MTPKGLRVGKWIGLVLLVGLSIGLLGQVVMDRLSPEPDLVQQFPEVATRALAEAVLARDAPGFAALIAQGADIGASGAEGLTLLQWRVLRGDIAGVRWLLERGADPNQQGRFGETVLHEAARFSNPAMLALLLDHGGNPNAPALRMGRSPLFIAMQARQNKTMNLLLARGADIEFADNNAVRPLLLAARINHSDAVVKLLRAGADPLATDDLGADFQSAYFRPDTDLLNAGAKRDRDWVIRFLQDRGIPLDPAALTDG